MLAPRRLTYWGHTGLDFLVQEVCVGDDADDFLVVFDDRNGRDVVFYEHIDEVKDRRIFLRRNDNFFP